MASSDTIEVYEGNTLEVACTVTGLSSLADFDGYLTVYDSDKVELFEEQGTINGLVITFDISQATNEIVAGKYEYEISIIKTTVSPNIHYTLKKDMYYIKQANKFLP